MNLTVERLLIKFERLLAAGYSIVVYQAYRPAIGHFAAEHGYFGGEFKL